jgi:hypothetical protein
MHNRARDVILEPELADDLQHLLDPADWTPADASGPARPLSAEQLLVGRFFFVHESVASRDTGAAERSFEFLHATFAEFLATRQIVTALAELAEDRGEPVVINCRRHAQLWRSQLDGETNSRLWHSFRVAWDLTSGRLLIRLEDDADVSLAASLPWPPETPPRAEDQPGDAVLTSGSNGGLLLRKSAFVQTTIDMRELLYVLTPFWQRFGDVAHRHGEKWDSDARHLWEALLGAPPGADREERADLYSGLLDHPNPGVRALALGALDGRTGSTRSPRTLTCIGYARPCSAANAAFAWSRNGASTSDGSAPSITSICSPVPARSAKPIIKWRFSVGAVDVTCLANPAHASAVSRSRRAGSRIGSSSTRWRCTTSRTT